MILVLFLSIQFVSCEKVKDPNLITASGNVEATEVTVSAKTAGQIQSLMVDEGADVKEGEVLVKLDHSLLDVQLRQSEATVEQSEAQLRLLQSGARKEDIKIAEKQVELAEINLQQAQEDKDRFAKLMETNTITRKQYDDVVTRYDQASNQLNTARENLQKAKTIIRPEEIESARANLKRSQAGADLVRKNIDDCTIVSPISGTVTKKFSEVGEYVTPGASLLNIADLSTVDLKIYVTGEDLGKIKTGQTAEVMTDTFKDKIYKGEIIYISPDAEFTPKNIQTKEERTKLVYAIKIRIPNPERELKSGMPADANIRVN
jgi:HlyD family secretion protein